MKSIPLIACAALLACAGPANAVKVLSEVNPKNAASEGFAVTTVRDDRGMLDFRVTREVAKARWQGRSANLEVRGAKGLIARCGVEPLARNGRDGTVTYRFQLAPEQAMHSKLTVAELQTDPANPDGRQLIGGGTYYEFRLADWAEPAAAK